MHVTIRKEAMILKENKEGCVRMFEGGKADDEPMKNTTIENKEN